VLNVDIGGGTSKFALIENGIITATCAIAVGARLPGEEVEVLAEALLATIDRPGPRLVTQAPAHWARPHLVTFSGGVAEYLFGRETRSFGDLGMPLAERLRRAFAEGRVGVPMMDPGHGIRATVIGASQFSVQVSGKTIHLSPNARLPVRNMPVVFPALDELEPAKVAAAVTCALARLDHQEAALGIRWQGEPHYRRLRGLAAGIAMAAGSGPGPLVLMVDRDVGRLLGHILEHELGVARGVISIDGIELREFDYVDIGELIEQVDVVPVVIKSLLFPVH